MFHVKRFTALQLGKNVFHVKHCRVLENPRDLGEEFHVEHSCVLQSHNDIL